MDIPDYIGACKYQQVIVALELLRMLGKQCSTEIGFSKSIALYHCAHCSVKHQNPIIYYFYKFHFLSFSTATTDVVARYTKSILLYPAHGIE